MKILYFFNLLFKNLINKQYKNENYTIGRER